MQRGRRSSHGSVLALSDQEGTVVAQFPVRTEADGHAKVDEAIAELNKRDVEGRD